MAGTAFASSQLPTASSGGGDVKHEGPRGEDISLWWTNKVKNDQKNTNKSDFIWCTCMEKKAPLPQLLSCLFVSGTHFYI